MISVKEVGKRIRVRLGDDTAVINAFLYPNDAIKEGATIALFRAEAKVMKEHIELQYMPKGRSEEGRRKINDVNDEVDISAKEWIEAE